MKEKDREEYSLYRVFQFCGYRDFVGFPQAFCGYGMGMRIEIQLPWQLKA